MQHLPRSPVPTSKSKLDDLSKPSSLKQMLVGLSFDDAENALKPAAAPPDARLGKAIGQATSVFEQEKADSGEETYLQRHDRHQRNKELKVGLTNLSPKERDKQYEAQRERSPESQRRIDNKKLKSDLKAGGAFDAQEYEYQRKYFGGPEKSVKAKAKIDDKRNDARIKADNAALLAQLQQQAQAPGANVDVQAEYESKRGKTTKDLAKEADKAKADGELSLLERLNPMPDDALQKKKEDIAQAEDKKAKAKKAAKAADKQAIKDAEERVDKGATWQQVASGMKLRGLSNDKLRKEWNDKVQKGLSREDYRRVKLHRTPKQGEVKIDKDVKNATNAIGGTLDGAQAGTLASRGIATAVGDTGVAGTKQLSDSGQTFTSGGTALQAGGILGGANAIVNATGAADQIVNGLKLRDSDDGAQRQEARTQIVDGTVKLSKSTTSGTTSVLKAVQAFTADPTVAAAMAHQGVPIVGIVGASISLVNACVQLAAGAERVHKGGKLRDDAKDQGKSDLAAALKGTRNADIQLVTSSSIDIITSLSAIVGHSLTLGGVTGPAGVALVGLSAGVSAVKSLAETVYESVEARAAKRSQVKYAAAVKRGDAREIDKRGKQMIGNNIGYAVQILVSAAREGDPIALGYLQMFGLDTIDFDRSSDENIRHAIFAVIGKNEDPETMLDTLKDVPNQVRAGKRALRKRLPGHNY